MSSSYQVTAEPCLIDLGAGCRAVVIADVPFLCDTTQHCANYPHVIEGGRRSSAVLQALNPARVGAMQVTPK